MENDRIFVDMSHLSVDEGPETDIVFGKDEIQGPIQSYTLSLVGCFLSEKSINFVVMKQTLASLWRPTLGMIVTQVQDNNLYVFQLEHVEADLLSLKKREIMRVRVNFDVRNPISAGIICRVKEILVFVPILNTKEFLIFVSFMF